MNDEPVILLLYVDDSFLTGEEKFIIDCKKKFVAEFEMKYLGLMHYVTSHSSTLSELILWGHLLTSDLDFYDDKTSFLHYDALR